MSNRVTTTSWIVLSLAIVLCAGVGYAAHWITSTATQRSNDTKAAITKANQLALNQRVERLAESTKEKRDTLTSIASADVVALVDAIDAAGDAAGIDAMVSDAKVVNSIPIVKNGDTLRAVVFNVEGKGSFTQVMHAAQLYEQLPLLSSIDQLEIAKIQSEESKTTNQWKITARIKVFTLLTI